MNPPAWDAEKLVNPHGAEDKRARVQKMFAAIAPSYDLNNHLHSLYIDQYWRRQAVRLAEVKAKDRIVDVACGTGDLSIKFAESLSRRAAKTDGVPSSGKVTGIDFTFEMLPIARVKAGNVNHSLSRMDPTLDPSWLSLVQFLAGDAQALPLPDASADVVSIAFGIRNVQDPLAALREFKRILRPGGRVIVLEFAVPKNPIVRTLYNFYCAQVMPLTATWISGDRSGAYKYLPHSVATFLTREQMTAKLVEAGFANVTATPLTFGTVVVYRGFVTD